MKKEARSKERFDTERKSGFLQSNRREITDVSEVLQCIDGFIQQHKDKRCCGWICYTSSLYYVMSGQKYYVSGSRGEEERGSVLSCELTCRLNDTENPKIISLHVRREGRYWSIYQYELSNQSENNTPIQYFEETYFSALTYENQENIKPKRWKYRLCWGKEMQDDIEVWEPKIGILVGLL